MPGRQGRGWAGSKSDFSAEVFGFARFLLVEFPEDEHSPFKGCIPPPRRADARDGGSRGRAMS